MIRRRAKGPNNDKVQKVQAAPVNPTSASAAPPAEAVPAGGDEASPVVLDELLAAFSGGAPAKKAMAKIDFTSPEVAELLASPEEMPTQSTRAMSSTEIVEQGGNVPPPAPGSDMELVSEPTRRSARRSKREAKRETKRENQRVAKHAKEQQKAQKQSLKRAQDRGKELALKQAGKKPSRKARRQAHVEGSAPVDAAAAAGVRVISHEEAAAGVVAPPPPGASAGPTVRIADDELPDPVYLEGDLGAGGSADVVAGARSTVFIDEDPSHADVVTMDVATSATRIEPRMRERRIAVRRAVGRRRLKWIAIVSAVGLVIAAALAVLGSGLFAIKEVEVEGAVYSVGPAFDAVVSELDGANVLRVDTDQAERDLKAIPWIADARVTSDFPNGATIEVRERVPSVAYQGPDGRYRVLDRDGRVLDVLDGQPTAYLELMVTDGTDLDPGQMSPRGYRAAATLVQALTPQMRRWALSVSSSADATDLRLLLDSASVGGPSGGGAARGIEVRFGAAEDLVDKLVRLQTALMNPNPDDVPTEMIDVSTADVVDR